MIKYFDTILNKSNGEPVVGATASVTDASGNPVQLYMDSAGLVPITNPINMVKTDGNGLFQFFILAGIYTLTCSYTGSVSINTITIGTFITSDLSLNNHRLTSLMPPLVPSDAVSRGFSANLDNVATFLGSGTPANLGFNYSFTATSQTLFEVGQQLVVNSSVGGANPTSAAKIGQFIACIGSPGSGAVYAQNMVAWAKAGAGDIILTGQEININTDNQNYGDSASAAGMATTLGVGSLVNTASAHRLSTAFGAYGVGQTTTQGLNRAYTAWGDSVRLSTFADYTNSTTSYEATGTHTNGIDLSGATFTNVAILLPDHGIIASKTASGSSLVQMAVLDGGNQLVIGVGSVNIVLGGNSVPITGNTYDLGNAFANWRRGYLQNLSLSNLSVYTDNTAAANAGLAVGEVYALPSGVLARRF